MGHWSVVVPRPDLYYPYNYIKNPSFERSATEYWTAVNCTPTRITTDAVYGSAACQFATTSAANYIHPNIAHPVEDDQSVVASVYVKNIGTATEIKLKIIDAGTQAEYAVDTLDTTSDWTRLICSWKNTTGVTKNIVIRIGSWDTEVTTLQVDAVQLVVYKTTAPAADVVELDYFDGDQVDAYWIGQHHKSYSQLAADTREHGQVLDLADDLELAIDTVSGSGLPNITNNIIDLALADGGYFARARATDRTLILRSMLSGSTLTGLYDKRRALVRALQPDRGRRNQPIRLWHRRPDEEQNDPSHRELRVRYDSGLELQKIRGFTDTFNLRLLATDPFFYQEKWDQTDLDVLDTPTCNNGAAKVDGAWLPISNTNPGAPYIYQVYPSENLGKLIILGEFTDWGNQSAGDNIIAISFYSLTPDVLGSGLNGPVRGVADGPDGCLYVVGNFTASGGTTLNGVAKWDGTTWTNLVTTAAASGYPWCLCFDENGHLYVAGNFTDLDGVAAADGIAKWDGTSWSALGTGISGGTPGRGIVSDLNGNIYVGGGLTNAGGTTVYKIARWDGSSWYMVGNPNATNPGLSGGTTVASMVMDDAGNIYIGGSFTVADDEQVDGICRYDGRAFHPLGAGAGAYGEVLALWWDRLTGDLYVYGDLDKPGDLVWVDNLAVWTGSSWRHVDIDPPATASWIAGCTRYHNLYLAFSTYGSTSCAGLTPVDNIGSERAYPVIKIAASGGTTRRLLSLANETTGARIHFDLDIADGEEITLDFRPSSRGITSSYGGPRLKILGTSALAEFYLVPGNNDITCFVDQAGSPTVTATIAWRPTFASVD